MCTCFFYHIMLGVSLFALLRLYESPLFVLPHSMSMFFLSFFSRFCALDKDVGKMFMHLLSPFFVLFLHLRLISGVRKGFFFGDTW